MTSNTPLIMSYKVLEQYGLAMVKTPENFMVLLRKPHC
ncbi:hypothetical protein SAMN05443633_101681 [Chryseobacterium arachidis]|uniref:Uncharacterized protein n=1 Tax=Chryseobacterium arachidis TaxID=1416778 RepID=A0A1M4V616_9FLAO|nr:hypothetical protein SAMN05443633_101681 [Chryseobacterium arachidis]